jgi:hypothetical protein
MLRLRIAAQREHLGAQVRAIEARLAGIDHRLAQARDFLRSPVAWAGGVALVLALGPRRLLRFASQALLALGTLRRMF